MTLRKEPFGKTPDGKAIEKYTFSNEQGLQASAMSWGATLLSVVMPDRDGKPGPITLSFDTPEEYEKKHAYLGSTVGRFANRIARGSFTLDGRTHTLAINDHANHLHGGIVGFDRVLWRAEGFKEPGRAGVRMRYLSRDGEEGYPGNLDVTVTFSLTEENELALQYDARTDAPTPVNLTNHAYWNLAGAGSGTIEGQELELACPRYLPVTDELLPTGEVKGVAGSPMDFTTSKPIGSDLGKVKGGYDHCYVRAETGKCLERITSACDPKTGRCMDIWTTLPAIQLYTGNFLGGVEDSNGKPYPRHGAFCLETQFYPDCVNRPEFPSCILRPGQVYHHVTRHQFWIRRPR